MKKVIEILMKRDNLTREEAKAFLAEAMNEVFYAMQNGDDPEEVFTMYTGLETDYLYRLIN